MIAALLAIFVGLAGRDLSGQPATLHVVSAATYQRDGALAPQMIAAGFSAALGNISASSTADPLPTTLVGFSMLVRDSAGIERLAPIMAIANGQISFLVPSAAAPGAAAFSLRAGDRTVAQTTARIALVAPGVFTANANGEGAPAGYALRARADGSRPTQSLYAPAQGGMLLPRPIDLDSGGSLYLVLFGTGIRAARSVTASLAAEHVPVSAFVPHPTLPGVDQVNIGPLPPRIADRRGETDLEIAADGVAANRVRVALNGPGMNAWGRRADLLEANSEMSVEELNGKIYVIGGYPSNRVTVDTVQVYDPVTDAWERTTPLPRPLNHLMTGSVNGKLYVIGGQTTSAGSGNFSDAVYEYDPATAQWRTRTPMPTARGGGAAAVLDGKIYVAGGRPPRGADFAVYDPQQDRWTVLPDLPTQRNHLGVAAAYGKIYVIGGRFEAGFESEITDVVEVFDPKTGAWSRAANMIEPRGGIDAVTAYGCIHVFGGEGTNQHPNGVFPFHEVYNPVTDTWTRLENMPIPVHGVTGAVFLAGLIYLPGGGTMQGGSSGGVQHQVFRPDMVCR